MNILYLLLPLALVVVIIFVGFYLWAAKHGQFDDLDSPAHRILLDDSKPKKTKDNSQQEKQD
jgi:cbb3-type cytochrome oxidase maturation protein